MISGHACVISAVLLIALAPMGVNAADDQSLGSAAGLGYTSVFDLSGGPGSAVNETPVSDKTSMSGSQPLSEDEASALTTQQASGDLQPTVQPWDLSATRSSESEPRQPTAVETTQERSAGKPKLGYDSAFDLYDRYEEVPTPAWIEANEQVGKIGGWRAYAREMYEADKAREAAEEKAREDASMDGMQ